jgi:hypothetical protein
VAREENRAKRGERAACWYLCWYWSCVGQTGELDALSGPWPLSRSRYRELAARLFVRIDSGVCGADLKPPES